MTAKIEIKLPESLQGEYNGRILFILDTPAKKGEEKEEELYKRIGMNGCPFFGLTCYGLKGGDTIDLTANIQHIEGYPIAFEDIPAKKLEVQAFFIRYHRYKRKDGHVLYGMEDMGGGGNFAENPGNLFSMKQVVKFGKEDISLCLDQTIPYPELKKGQVLQQGNYEDHGLVRYTKIRSKLLSDFWNHDVYIGSNVLLPHNYDPKKRYPVLYCQGHWPGEVAPMRYGTELREGDKEFTDFWNSEEGPEFIMVCNRDANIFYDDSYHVNSANLGPYGDALIQEVIPDIEKKFGGIGTPESRILLGGSTGGWESMALMLYYPKFFGGTWPMFPDGMDFHAFQVIDLYNDKNAYELDYGWRTSERPAFRDTRGNVIWTVRQENQYELALGGDKAHGMGQWGIWDAVYSPVGEDGYPQTVFDPKTGKINRKVVKYWHDHYDLNVYLQKNTKKIMKDLKGKIHLRGGDMDNFYLNLSQYAITETLESLDYQGYSKTFPRVGHSANMTTIELLKEIEEYLKKRSS